MYIHLIDHAMVDLVNRVFNYFGNNCYTLVVFIDLTKAFDTVDYNIQLKDLFRYGVRGNNLKILQSYLQIRKQFIAYQYKSKTEYKNVMCGVSQESIFVLYYF